MDIDPDKIANSPFTIGALGALVAAIKFTPGGTWVEKGINVFSGALIAGFLAPALVDFLKMSSPSYQSGAAFAVGLLGMSVVAAVIQGIKDTPLGQIITGWISKKG